MSPSNPEWPELLRGYETAIAEFESVSRALTATLTEGNGAADEDISALIVAEERARETVILARMRLINRWRESGAELSGFGADDSGADPRAGTRPGAKP